MIIDSDSVDAGEVEARCACKEQEQYLFYPVQLPLHGLGIYHWRDPLEQCCSLSIDQADLDCCIWLVQARTSFVCSREAQGVHCHIFIYSLNSLSFSRGGALT